MTLDPTPDAAALRFAAEEMQAIRQLVTLRLEEVPKHYKAAHRELRRMNLMVEARAVALARRAEGEV